MVFIRQVQAQAARACNYGGDVDYLSATFEGSRSALVSTCRAAKDPREGRGVQSPPMKDTEMLYQYRHTRNVPASGQPVDAKALRRNTALICSAR